MGQKQPGKWEQGVISQEGVARLVHIFILHVGYEKKKKKKEN